MSFVGIGVGGAAAIGAAGSIASGVIGANAASNAADTQAAAAHEANQLQQQQYDQTRADQQAAAAQSRADLDPWRKSGMTALDGMQNSDFQRDFGAGDFNQDPGYQFRMAEGQKALERSAAARGGLQSGGMMKALTKYGQGVASDEYGKAYDRFNADRDRRFGRLSALSGSGQNAAAGMGAATQNAAGQIGAAGSRYASAVGENNMGAANAAGAAGMAQANAIGGAFSGIGGAVNGAIAQNRQDKWMDRWMSSQGK